MADEETLEAPEVHAVVVAGTEPDTEAVDVLVAWTNLDEIEEIATAVLGQIREELGQTPTFGGQVSFFLPPAYAPDDPPAITKLGMRLTMSTMFWRTAAGKAWTIRVVRGLAPSS